MEVSTKNIDKEFVIDFALALYSGITSVPLEHSLSCMQGLVAATAKYAQYLKEQSESISEEDGIEKTILYWLATTDKVTGLNFTKYINEKAL